MQYETFEKKDILKKLFWYSVPLIIGNIVLLSYDLVDALVISKFVGEKGLAAVSTAGQISSLTLLFFYGLCMGAAVIISEYYGAKEIMDVKFEISTTLITGGIFAVSVSTLLAIFAKGIFTLMQVPSDVMGDTVLYLRIACIGLPFVFVYNVYGNALKAMGNSKVPTFFLAFSAVVNIILDLVFVVIFSWGVAGASIATVIAQVSSCILIYIYMYVKVKELRFKKGEFMVRKRLAIRTFRDGLVTAIQQAVPPLGKTLVMAKVNTLGVIAMATNGIINRVDNFAILPAQNIALSIMTFTAQSRGAKRNDLIYDIFKKGMVLELGFSAIVFTTLFFFKNNIMVALAPVGSTEVVEMGNSYLQIMSFGYLLVAFTNTFHGFFRGMGNMTLTLYDSLLNISTRVFVVYAFMDIWKFNALAWGTIIGWVILNAFAMTMFFYHRKTKWADVYVAPTKEEVEQYKS
ncbi:MAG: MATE family efflux transporter [Lachnospiraceae bacterium]|nr:MATE family efflux transporter [Lachnospiraceae bacterium]